MKFKEDKLLDQFQNLPHKLQEIAIEFASLSEAMGKEAVITRIKDPVTGDSGVHEANRGIDFRDETVNDSGDRSCLYAPEEVNYLTSTINNRYPRVDGRLVCIHHSFQGMPYHFHLQIPVDWT